MGFDDVLRDLETEGVEPERLEKVTFVYLEVASEDPGRAEISGTSSCVYRIG